MLGADRFEVRKESFFFRCLRQVWGLFQCPSGLSHGKVYFQTVYPSKVWLATSLTQQTRQYEGLGAPNFPLWLGLWVLSHEVNSYLESGQVELLLSTPSRSVQMRLEMASLPTRRDTDSTNNIHSFSNQSQLLIVTSQGPFLNTINRESPKLS